MYISIKSCGVYVLMLWFQLMTLHATVLANSNTTQSNDTSNILNNSNNSTDTATFKDLVSDFLALYYGADGGFPLGFLIVIIVGHFTIVKYIYIHT